MNEAVSGVQEKNVVFEVCGPRRRRAHREGDRRRDQDPMP
jgi:hypothetical protein